MHSQPGAQAKDPCSGPQGPWGYLPHADLTRPACHPTTSEQLPYMFRFGRAGESLDSCIYLFHPMALAGFPTNVGMAFRGA